MDGAFLRVGPRSKREYEVSEDIIQTLVTQLAPPTVTSGFNTPFTMERLCHAFGENLGGNAPDPSWFEGYDVVVAVRRGSRGTPYMPTAALLQIGRAHV